MTPSVIHVADDRQPLLVPYDLRDEARRIGARWDPDLRTWSIARSHRSKAPRRMLPLRDRPDLEPPYIRINLIPQTSWGRNLRALMPKDEWREFARAHVYARTGSVCLVCGGRGPQWPVEADEVWHFDDAAGVQRLADVVPLCPCCHEVRSAGYATSNGRGEDAARHLAWVERIALPEARRRIADALETWRRRSRRNWIIDISLMERRHGIRIEHDAGRTDGVNAQLVGEARWRSAGRGSRSISTSQVMRHLFG